MTKADLVEKLVERGIARSAAMEAVEGVITVMTDTLASGETITLRGLGTFQVRTIKSKVARNIAKGTPVLVPEHRTVKLILSNKIKEALK
ncbi:MAG: integration host factor subunit beta [Bacteroides sp.]|nr:integration host factor subunit beta [Bacteroides sp.]